MWRSSELLAVPFLPLALAIGQENGLLKRTFGLCKPAILPMLVEVSNIASSPTNQRGRMTVHTTLSLTRIRQMRCYRTVSSVGPNRGLSPESSQSWENGLNYENLAGICS